jgi:hypothetical protein
MRVGMVWAAVMLLLFAACAREEERAEGQGATGTNVTGRGEDPPRAREDFTGTPGVGGEADISPPGQRAEETWGGRSPGEQQADRLDSGAQQRAEGTPAPVPAPGDAAGEADRTAPGTTGANWLLLALIVLAVAGGAALALRYRRP